MSLIEIASYLFSAVVMVVVLFQLALAGGVPFGSVAMGGRFPGRLPPAMRIAAVIQAGLMLLFITIVQVRAGQLLPQYFPFSQTAIWFVVGISVVSLILNTITPSRLERILWSPVALVMVVASGFIAADGW